MKKKILHFYLAFILFCSTGSLYAQGGNLNLNSTVNGSLLTSTTDTWDLTTTADGFLQLSLTALGTADFFITLYDNNGTTILQGPIESFNTIMAQINADGLAPGAYHVGIVPF